MRVLYGNGNVLICNSDCSCLHLLTYIRDTCAPQANVLSLDLCTEKGRLSGCYILVLFLLLSLEDISNVAEAGDLFLDRVDDFLKSRQTYILVQVTRILLFLFSIHEECTAACGGSDSSHFIQRTKELTF